MYKSSIWLRGHLQRRNERSPRFLGLACYLLGKKPSQLQQYIKVSHNMIKGCLEGQNTVEILVNRFLYQLKLFLAS